MAHMSPRRALGKRSGEPGGRALPVAPGDAGLRLGSVISRLRTSIAIALALTVTLLTLGSVRVSWTGRPGAQDGAEDPGRAAATRTSAPGSRGGA